MVVFYSFYCSSGLSCLSVFFPVKPCAVHTNCLIQWRRGGWWYLVGMENERQNLLAGETSLHPTLPPPHFFKRTAPGIRNLQLPTQIKQPPRANDGGIPHGWLSGLRPGLLSETTSTVTWSPGRRTTVRTCLLLTTAALTGPGGRKRGRCIQIVLVWPRETKH